MRAFFIFNQQKLNISIINLLKSDHKCGKVGIIFNSLQL